MEERLIARRVLPDGRMAAVAPFHFCLKGLEMTTLCRDDEDYDVFVKYIFITAHKCNVIVIIYTVVSNHTHVALLSENRENVERFGIELKRVQSMWLSRKYGDIEVLRRVHVSVSMIDTVQYARNVLAYIPKNAFDNGCRDAVTYRWGGCRAMFASKTAIRGELRKVCELSTRSVERIFHTGADLSDVKWMLDSRNELDPHSACDCEYLERIYNNDQSFFLRKIGGVNDCDIKYDFAEAKLRLSDTDFVKSANDYSNQWYGLSIEQMTMKQKAAFLKYLGTKLYLSIPQVSRCFHMERALVRELIGKK